MLAGAATLAQQGFITGASARNWASYGHEVHVSPDLLPWQRDLLCDPQTSGGLLIAVAPAAAGEVIARLHTAGFSAAAAIGTMSDGPAQITVAL